jgi:peptide deformylase
MPKQLDIILHPNPILRKKSEELDLEKLKDPKFKVWLKDLEETMVIKDGAGLAAPQVGKNLRIFVALYKGKNVFFINPKITKRSWGKVIDDEGCLSVLDKKGEIIYAKVSRHKKVNCSYYDETGKLKKISADKFLARVIQHENDHLDGILFIDRIEK